MPFASLHVADFPVQAVARLQPELRGREVAVLEGAPPLEVVAAASAEARAAGVEAGMSVLQARACAHTLVFQRRMAEQEKAASAALLDCARSVSPRVESIAPETVVLDLEGVERLFGPPQQVARLLAGRAAALGLEVRVAVAANPDAALHAARGFPGVTLIPAGKEAGRLGGLPLDVLDAPPEILETLDRWGVRTFRALAALPQVAVAERLGQEGVRLQKLAAGAGRRELSPAEEPETFAESLELEFPVATLEPLAFVLARLLQQLCARLQARALATNELQLRLELESRDGAACVHQRALRLPVPLGEARVFLKLLQLDLMAHPPPAPVRKVALAAAPVKPRVEQHGLFLPQAPQPQKLEVVLARLGGGAEHPAAGSPQLEDTHRPRAFHMARFHPVAAPGVAARRESARAPLMAMRLFRPPLAATVEVRGGRLQRVASSAARGAVVWLAGPWRASGEWWDEESGGWARDEWDVALENPRGVALFRLYRDLASGCWFVEGSYD
ncbi:MAG: DNA polymerase Y family protein [Terriglobales bacterium]